MSEHSQPAFDESKAHSEIALDESCMVAALYVERSKTALDVLQGHHKIGGRRNRTESASNAARDLNPARYTTPGAPSAAEGDAVGSRRLPLVSPHLPRGSVGRCGKPVDAEATTPHEFRDILIETARPAYALRKIAV